jgi:hypothetical protein
MKNLYNSFVFKLPNNLLEELVLLLSVWYVIACYAITVTKLHSVSNKKYKWGILEKCHFMRGQKKEKGNKSWLITGQEIRGRYRTILIKFGREGSDTDSSSNNDASICGWEADYNAGSNNRYKTNATVFVMDKCQFALHYKSIGISVTVT